MLLYQINYELSSITNAAAAATTTTTATTTISTAAVTLSFVLGSQQKRVYLRCNNTNKCVLYSTTTPTFLVPACMQVSPDRTMANGTIQQKDTTLYQNLRRGPSLPHIWQILTGVFWPIWRNWGSRSYNWSSNGEKPRIWIRKYLIYLLPRNIYIFVYTYTQTHSHGVV